MTNFDWRTDEDKGWEQPGSPQSPPRARRRLWGAAWSLAGRHWRLLLAGLFLLLAAGGLGYRALIVRVRETEALAREEVLAAYDLLVDAARDADAELFLTMLGGDRSWRQEQLAAFESHAFIHRSPLELDWQTEVEPQTEILFSPDLQEALVTSTVRYEGYAGGSALQQLDLRHTWQFSKDGAQWRLAPVAESFWGGWVTFNWDGLHAVFPRRDEALGIRLAEDIQARLGSICDSVGGCPSPFTLQLQFEYGHETISAPIIWARGPRNRISLSLPAPSLVGVPADDAAYRALRNAYLRTIVEQLFEIFHPQDSAQDGTFRDALRRRSVVALDLTPWPPAPGDGSSSRAALNGDILALCAEEAGQGASLLRYLGHSEMWTGELQSRDLMRLVPLDGVPGVLLSSYAPLAINALPGTSWWGYGRELAFFEGYSLGGSIPSSPAFTAATADGQDYWTYLGHATECDGRDCAGIVTRDEPTTWSPDGEHSLFRRELEGSRSPPAADDMLWLGDRNGGALQRLGEGFYPFWIDEETFGYLVVPDGREQSFPFDYELVIRRLEGQTAGSATPMPLRIDEALRQLAPDDEETGGLGIAVRHVFVHRARPQTVYILGVHFSSLLASAPAPQHNVFLFAVDAMTGEVTVRVPTEQLRWVNLPRLSPDGRWLAFTAFDPRLGRGVVAVHDLTADPAQANVYERAYEAAAPSTRFESSVVAPSFDWSQRGGKLLILDQGIVHVLEPGTWAAQQVVPPTPSCAYAAWAD